MNKRYIIFTDTHGCIDEFKQLISLAKPKEDDIIISLGDNVDRGPSSAACLAYCIKIGARLCIANHENRLIRWKSKEESVIKGIVKNNDIKLSDIHKASITDIDNHPESKRLWDYIQNKSENMIRFEVNGINYVCVHAGLHPIDGLSTHPDSLMRIRKVDGASLRTLRLGTNEFDKGVYWADLWNGPERVVFGHNVFPEVANFSNAIGIDTGCVFGEKLTALIVNSDGTEETISVEAKKTYYKKRNK